MGPEVQKVIARIKSMSDHQVRERYHELVDKRPDLNALERFELERIEAHLDAEDRDPQLEAREREWQEERVQLLNSVEELLFRGARGIRS
jgi:GTP1/Obg family GTP-binding protein